MAIEVGARVPDVTFYWKTKEGVKPVKVQDFLKESNVVLLFFPAVYTSVCTVEMCTIRDDIGTYNGLNAKVLGVSGDMPYSQQRWAEELNLNMPLISDYNRDAMKAYGVEYDSWAGGMQGVSKRSAFVIDKAGVVRYAWVTDNASDLPSFTEIQNALQSIG